MRGQQKGARIHPYKKKKGSRNRKDMVGQFGLPKGGGPGQKKKKVFPENHGGIIGIKRSSRRGKVCGYKGRECVPRRSPSCKGN